MRRGEVARECLDRIREWVEARRKECLSRLGAEQSPQELVRLSIEWNLLARLEGELSGEVAIGKRYAENG